MVLLQLPEAVYLYVKSPTETDGHHTSCPYGNILSRFPPDRYKGLPTLELKRAWSLLLGWAYHLARGWIMYCDGCGTRLTSGGQFCTKCGKPIVPSAASSSPGLGRAGAPAAAAAVSNGRVRRNLHRLAILWMISGILRLMGIVWMMIFGKMFFPFMRGWGGPVVWPIGGRWGLDVPFSLGVVLALFGVRHLILAWGLFELEPWARMLGLVLGFLALLRPPFGTDVEIYTIWVLLPHQSGQEYERLSQSSVEAGLQPGR